MVIQYNRESAINYAKTWAYKRNPKFYDFSNLGGDCTNFVSQCIYNGVFIMNYTPTYGWYYNSINDRTASWTGVKYFYEFITKNYNNVGNGNGPFGIAVTKNDIEIGDVIQLGVNGEFKHSAIVVGFDYETPLVATHSNDAFNKPLTAFNFDEFRYIHILGARK